MTHPCPREILHIIGWCWNCDLLRELVRVLYETTRNGVRASIGYCRECKT
jgi:hypothetical protein